MTKQILQWVSALLFMAWATSWLFFKPSGDLFNMLGLLSSFLFLFSMLVYENKNYRLRRRIEKHKRNRMRNQAAE